MPKTPASNCVAKLAGNRLIGDLIIGDRRTGTRTDRACSVEFMVDDLNRKGY